MAPGSEATGERPKVVERATLSTLLVIFLFSVERVGRVVKASSLVTRPEAKLATKPKSLAFRTILEGRQPAKARRDLPVGTTLPTTPTIEHSRVPQPPELASSRAIVTPAPPDLAEGTPEKSWRAVARRVATEAKGPRAGIADQTPLAATTTA